MGMTCKGCGEWSETVYNAGSGGVNYCPCCGVDLQDTPPEWDDEEENAMLEVSDYEIRWEG